MSSKTMTRKDKRALPLLPNGRSRIHGSDLAIGIFGIVGITTALWVQMGGVTRFVAGGSSTWLAVADLTGLYAGLAGLAGLVLVARPASIERKYGLDRMFGWHRWTGMSLAYLTFVHVIVSVMAYMGPGSSFLVGFAKESIAIQQLQWMVAATVSTALIALVSVTSWRRLRKKMAYETWYFLHVLGYLGIVLAVGHALVLGVDMRNHFAAQAWWVALYLATFTLMAWRRVGPAITSLLRGRLEVTRVRPAGPDMVAITVSGPGMASLRGRAGQFYRVRFGGRGWRWQSHPYSVSAMPTTAGLEFSVKHAGDGSAALMRARVGTRVWVEGPYGHFTREAADGRPLLFIGGGSGLAPIRALLQESGPDDRPIVVLRAPHRGEIPYAGEVEKLAESHDGAAFHILGRTSQFKADPFSPEVLLAAVPDAAERAAFLCGPTGLVMAARRGLIAAGVPSDQIHSERFDY